MSDDIPMKSKKSKKSTKYQKSSRKSNKLEEPDYSCRYCHRVVAPKDRAHQPCKCEFYIHPRCIRNPKCETCHETFITQTVSHTDWDPSICVKRTKCISRICTYGILGLLATCLYLAIIIVSLAGDNLLAPIFGYEKFQYQNPDNDSRFPGLLFPNRSPGIAFVDYMYGLVYAPLGLVYIICYFCSIFVVVIGSIDINQIEGSVEQHKTNKQCLLVQIVALPIIICCLQLLGNLHYVFYYYVGVIPFKIPYRFNWGLYPLWTGLAGLFGILLIIISLVGIVCCIGLSIGFSIWGIYVSGKKSILWCCCHKYEETVIISRKAEEV